MSASPTAGCLARQRIFWLQSRPFHASHIFEGVLAISRRIQEFNKLSLFLDSPSLHPSVCQSILLPFNGFKIDRCVSLCATYLSLAHALSFLLKLSVLPICAAGCSCSGVARIARGCLSRNYAASRCFSSILTWEFGCGVRPGAKSFFGGASLSRSVVALPIGLPVVYQRHFVEPGNVSVSQDMLIDQ